METARANLLQAVDRERRKRKMSDREFSKQVLGISHSYLSLLRAGKRRLTPNLAVLFMQKLPEIAPEVTIFVMRQGNDGNIPKVATQTEGGKPALGQLSTPTKRKGRKT